MRREIAELIEAVRSLKLRREPQPNAPKHVRIGASREEFLDGLWRITDALEAVDRAGGAATDMADEDPSMEPAKLRAALDGVFRWMKASGVDITDPLQIVAASLGAEQKPKHGKNYRPAPPHVKNAFMKQKRPGPLLRLDPKPGDRIDMQHVRDKGQEVLLVEAELGAAAPVSRGR